jgi:hypothetical protein
VKPVQHTGTRKGNISKEKLMSLKLVIKTKQKILAICRGINEFKEEY